MRNGFVERCLVSSQMFETKCSSSQMLEITKLDYFSSDLMIDMCHNINRDLKIYDAIARRRVIKTKQIFIEDSSYEEFVDPGVFSRA